MIRRYVENTYKIADPYKEILIFATDAKVNIEPSKDEVTELVIFERKRMPYKFSIQDNILTIETTKKRWYNFLKVGMDHSKIKLCVPKSITEKISVISSIGSVDISSIDCSGAIDIQVNTGNVSLDSVCCASLASKGNTGSVALNSVISKEKIEIKRNTGKVSLNDCSAPEIFVKTNTGKVCGKLPPNTVFNVRTNTGKVEVPNPSVGEIIGSRCEIKTNTGNIKFE